MKLADLQALIAAGESLTLEFKKSTAEKERACRTLCAFANAQGGRLLFGVTPAGKITGQQVTDHTLEELAQEFQGFEPPLFPKIERISLAEGREVLLLHVNCPTLQPVSFRGVPYERVLNTTRVIPRASYQRLLLESLHATERWETQPAQGWTVDKLDAKEITATTFPHRSLARSLDQCLRTSRLRQRQWINRRCPIRRPFGNHLPRRTALWFDTRKTSTAS